VSQKEGSVSTKQAQISSPLKLLKLALFFLDWNDALATNRAQRCAHSSGYMADLMLTTSDLQCIATATFL
jgi:hypothetical protein